METSKSENDNGKQLHLVNKFMRMMAFTSSKLSFLLYKKNLWKMRKKIAKYMKNY